MHELAQLLGAVAQLGERSVRNAEVEGSIPFRSILMVFDDLFGDGSSGAGAKGLMA